MERPDRNDHIDIQAGRRAQRAFQTVTLGDGARRRHREQLARHMAGGVLEERSRRSGELAVITTVLVIILAVTLWQYAGSRLDRDVATSPADVGATAAISVEPAESIRAGEVALDTEDRTRRELRLIIPSPAPTEATVAALADQAERFLNETGVDVVAVLAWRDEAGVGDTERIIGRAYVSRDGHGWGEPDAVHNTFQDDQGDILVELFLWPDGQLSPDGRLTSVHVVPRSE